MMSSLCMLTDQADTSLSMLRTPILLPSAKQPPSVRGKSRHSLLLHQGRKATLWLLVASSKGIYTEKTLPSASSRHRTLSWPPQHVKIPTDRALSNLRWTRLTPMLWPRVITSSCKRTQLWGRRPWRTITTPWEKPQISSVSPRDNTVKWSATGGTWRPTKSRRALRCPFTGQAYAE